MKNFVPSKNFNLVRDLYMVSIKELYGLLHKKTENYQILSDYIRQNLMQETAPFKLPDGQVKALHLFHTIKSGKNTQHLYIIRSAIPYFLKKYLNELIKLDIPRENIYATLKLIPTLLVSSRSNPNYLMIWNVAARCTRNSKITSKFAQYIKEKYLLETYPLTDTETGEVRQEPMFVFSKKAVGKNAVFMKKEALPIFLERYKSELLQKALEFEQENDFISLRGLGSYLGNTELDKKLIAFIQKHLDETFVITDENGTTTTQKTFILSKAQNGQNILNVHKKGIKSFIQNHAEALMELGYTSIPALLKNEEKIGYKKGYLSLREIAKRLHQKEDFADKIRPAIHHHYSNDTFIETDEFTGKKTERPFFYSRVAKHSLYFIKEEDFISFCERYQNLLVKHGVKPEIIAHILQKNNTALKTDDMISFREFTSIIKKNGRSANKLLTHIREHHLNDTYIDVDENWNMVRRPVFTFAYDKNGNRGFSYYFTDKKAMYAFLRRQKDLFIAHKVKEDVINHITNDKQVAPYSKDYIFISQFSRIFHLHKEGFSDYIRQNYLDETVIKKTADGTEVLRPMFVLMQQPKLGSFCNYAISKEDLKIFIVRHKDELGINPLVVKTLLNDGKIQKVDDRYLSLSELSQLLKVTGTKSTPFIGAVKKMFDDTIKLKPTDKTAQPVFVLGTRDKHNPCIYINLDCLSGFLKSRYTDLIQLGVSDKNIAKAIFTHEKEPDYYANYFMQKRLQLKEEQRKYRILRKQKGERSRAE